MANSWSKMFWVCETPRVLTAVSSQFGVSVRASDEVETLLRQEFGLVAQTTPGNLGRLVIASQELALLLERYGAAKMVQQERM
eukprot:4658467-Amphidinium_carterae.2